MKNLIDYKEQMEITKDGYVCQLGYSTDKTVDLVLKDDSIVNVSRDVFGLNCKYSLQKGNKVHFDKDMNFKTIEEVKPLKRYSWS